MHRTGALLLVGSMWIAGCGGGNPAPATSAAPATTGAVTTVDTAAPDGPLSLELSGTGGPAAGPVEITVTLRSTGGEIRVARPFLTPNLIRFTVIAADGSEVPFDGPYVRLAPLEEGDFAELAPDGSLSQTFDLAAHFTLTPGGYTVTAEYRNVPGGPGDDGAVFTAEPGSGVGAAPLEIEVTP